MSAIALDEGVAVYRTARKPWSCQCPGSRHHNCPHVGCRGQIDPGDRYVEYLGEAAAYESGTRYCLPCGVETWQAGWRDHVFGGAS